jgi:hypothetical protein
LAHGTVKTSASTQTDRSTLSVARVHPTLARPPISM